MTMPKVRWFDDWFAIDEIAPGLFGIGEPKYHQINWNYLIVGQEGVFMAPEDMFFGNHENMIWEPVAIRQWWPIGHRIDLGGNSLEIIATPGHSPESISLYDAGRNILLAADFLYLGNLYGQIPGAFLPDYLVSAEALSRHLPEDLLILGAHGKPLADGTQVAPRLSGRDLRDLVAALRAIRDGNMPPTGQNPDRYRINDRLALLAGPQSYGAWR